MEQNQEKKFICKFCNKGYPCGKSLGGHIRTHMNNNENSGGAKQRAEISINKLLSSNTNARNMKRSSGVVEAVEAGGQSGTYALRENPKKSKRLSDPGNSSLLKEMICKECGKGFQSMKALCGHMACHSEKFEDHKLVVDESHSDTETSSTPSKRRRSKRRIRNNNKASGGVYYSNGSSSVSVIEEQQQQEEIAMCLMMLSRDSGGCKKRLNSVADSSDNNSVILEAKSSSIDVRITIKNDMKCVEKQRDENIKLKSCESSPCSENFSSGLKVKPRSGFEDSDAKPGTILSKFKCAKTELPKDLVSEVADNEAGRGFTKLKRSGKNGYCSSMHDRDEDSLANGGSCDKATKFSNGKGLSTVPCGNAEKIFGSKKKNKGHECPFCYKVFKSGQALGGHKRFHFVGGSVETTLVIKQDTPLPTLIDLNLPAPVEEDAW